MKRIVLAAVAIGAIAVGGGAVAFAQGGDAGTVTIEVTGGPEGVRTLTTPLNKDVQVTTTEGHTYTLNFLLDGKQADNKKFPGGSNWDCGGSDQYGPEVNYGCVVSADQG